MTLTRAGRRRTTVTHRRLGREMVGGICAVALLVALTVGLPLLLLVVAPLTMPEQTPAWADLVASLTRPDDGSLLRGALALLAWGGWAVFALSILLESAAVLRGRPTPRVPVLRLPQRGAAVLVAAVVIGFAAPAGGHSTAGAVAHAAPPVTASTASTVAVAHSAPPVAAAPTRTRATRGTERAVPEVVVRSHDTLWVLAERHLGSGPRYREIVELNRGRAQADGRTLTDPHWIYPGWVLQLPPDASGPGVRQPARLPALRARPGPESLIPERGVAAAPATGVARTTTVPAAAAAVDRGPIATPAPTLVSAASGGTDRTALAAASTPAGDASESGVGAVPLLALGLGAATVGGVLAEIARQRRSRQRTRRTGTRITLPVGSDAEAERAWRSLPSAPQARLSAGLALLVDGCAQTGRPLPRIAAVRVRAEAMELILTDEDPAQVPPFSAACPGSWVWDGPVPEVLADPDRADPCPGLLSVGTQGPDLVLVNLEAAGTLRIGGDQDQSAPVLAALTVELIGRARADAVTVDVVNGPTGPGPLGELAGERGVRTASPEQASIDLSAHEREVRTVLTDNGVGDVLTARSDGVVDASWTPRVVIGPGAGIDVRPEPFGGAAAVLTGQGPGWSLRPDVEDAALWRLEPVGITVLPQLLPDRDQHRLARLLAAASENSEGDGPLSEQVARTLGLLNGIRVPDGTGSGTAPRVLLLGAAQVDRAEDNVIPGRVRRATELVAYLVLHPGASRHEVDDVLWPGHRVGRSTRNPFVSRTRQWLGRTPSGAAYLPLVADGGGYRLLDEIGCDWYDFVRHARTGLTRDPVDAAELAAALALVRGRPFQGIDPDTYTWAEVDAQDMVSAIVDVAHLLAVHLLLGGDVRGAARAAARGLAVEPGSEALHRDAIRAAAGSGDPAGVRRSVARMNSTMESLELSEDLMPETQGLLAQLGITRP